MIEMGDLREGMGEELIEFYGDILKLPTSKL
jgi:hypothetical protein